MRSLRGYYDATKDSSKAFWGGKIEVYVALLPSEEREVLASKEVRRDSGSMVSEGIALLTARV